MAVMPWEFFCNYAGLSNQFRHHYMNKDLIDFNAELQEWLNVRLCEVLGDNSENIGNVVFNVHKAKEDIIRSFYDYQLFHGWPAIAKNTGYIVGYDESAIRKFIQRKH